LTLLRTFLSKGQVTKGQVLHCLHPLHSANWRRGCQTMTKKYKTSQKNRESYIYYSGGKEIATIMPDEKCVTEKEIEILHSEDELEVDEGRRYDYRIACNIESYVDENGESKAEHNQLLANWDVDPLNENLEMTKGEEEQRLIEQLH